MKLLYHCSKTRFSCFIDHFADLEASFLVEFLGKEGGKDQQTFLPLPVFVHTCIRTPCTITSEREREEKKKTGHELQTPSLRPFDQCMHCVYYITK